MVRLPLECNNCMKAPWYHYLDFYNLYIVHPDRLFLWTDRLGQTSPRIWFWQSEIDNGDFFTCTEQSFLFSVRHVGECVIRYVCAPGRGVYITRVPMKYKYTFQPHGRPWKYKHFLGNVSLWGRPSYICCVFTAVFYIFALLLYVPQPIWRIAANCRISWFPTYS